MHGHKIKIAHIVEGFEGGLSTYLCSVLPQLASEDFDVSLICSTNRHCPTALEQIAQLKGNGVKVYIIPMHRELNVFKDIVSLCTVLSLMLIHRFDIVHTHCSKAGTIGRLAAFVAGVPVSLHSAHCFAFLRTKSLLKRSFYRFVEKTLGKLTTRFVAVSKSEAEIAVAHQIYPRGKTLVIRNGLPLEQRCGSTTLEKRILNRQSLGLKKEMRVVATACRLVDYKGIFRFLEAASMCRTSNTVFLIAGEGPLKSELQTFIAAHNLADKVKLLGYVTCMEDLYSICDVVTLCSDSEAQPYLLLEAMRAGRPAVATNVVGNSELLADERGMLVDANPEAIAHGIDSLLADKQRCQEYAENAHRWFLENHLLQKQVSELVDSYRSCLVNIQGEYARGELTTH